MNGAHIVRESTKYLVNCIRLVVYGANYLTQLVLTFILASFSGSLIPPSLYLYTCVCGIPYNLENPVDPLLP